MFICISAFTFASCLCQSFPSSLTFALKDLTLLPSNPKYLHIQDRHSCHAVWECECHRSHDRARVVRQNRSWDLGHLGFHCRLSWICSILSSWSSVSLVNVMWLAFTC